MTSFPQVGAHGANLESASTEIIQLILYVAGQTPKSMAAFANLKKVCEEHLPGRHRIEVVDLLEQPQLGAETRSWRSRPWCESSPSRSVELSATCRTRPGSWSASTSAHSLLKEYPPVGENSADATVRFERALSERCGEQYVLKLYVTGMTGRSVEAIRTVRATCDEHLEGRYQLEVIDINNRPARLRDEHIIAIPTLVRNLPLPTRRLVGGLSDKSRVMRGLELRVDDESKLQPRD